MEFMEKNTNVLKIILTAENNLLNKQYYKNSLKGVNTSEIF